jgi:hypothetical protein
MPSPRYPVGAESPYALVYRVTSRTFDLSTVTAASFSYRRAAGRGLAGVWPAQVRNRQARQLDVYYAFQEGDLPVPDTVVFVPLLSSTLGPGELQAAQRSLVVFASPVRVFP